MSKVAIVMATYNGEKYVREQLDSILVSNFQDFEIFIYDDGSRDDTLRILTSYESKYPEKIKVHQNQGNLGVTRNFLQGVCNTSSEYIMLCDQDDVWNPYKISMTLKKLRQMEETYGKEKPLAVFTDATVVDHKLRMLHESFFRTSHLNPRKTDLAHILMENKLIGCTVMVNAALRKVLLSKELPTKAKLHDGWIAIVAAAMGHIEFINKPTLLYRQHGNNVVGNVSYLNYIKDRLINLRKQKEAILEAQNQAQEFCELYKEYLTKDCYNLIWTFAHLNNRNYIVRRYQMLRYGYLKTGLIRNVGLMIIA